MITRVQSNLNNVQSFGSLNVERIRVPRKSNEISFTSNPASSNTKKAGGFIKKGFEAVKKTFNNIIHSKFVQKAKETVKKVFKGAVNFVKSIPGKISKAFNNLKNKKA